MRIVALLEAAEPLLRLVEDANDLDNFIADAIDRGDMYVKAAEAERDTLRCYWSSRCSMSRAPCSTWRISTPPRAGR